MRLWNKINSLQVKKKFHFITKLVFVKHIYILAAKKAIFVTNEK